MKSASPSTVTPLRDFSDRLSPMVVKELRYGLRTRFFATSLICFHGLLIMLTGSILIGVNLDSVNQVFWALTIILMLGVLPLRGFNALASEAEGGMLDMLALTAISSFRIVFGKWVSLYSQSLLLASSLLPYLIARHQFGGVNIFREGLALAILLPESALATAAFIGFSRKTAKWLRPVLDMVVMSSMLPLCFCVYKLGVGPKGDQMAKGFLSLSAFDQIMLVAGGISLVVYTVFFFVSMGASTIAPTAENHSIRKRIIALSVLVTLTLTGCALSLYRGADAASWALYPLLFITIANGMDVVTETMPRAPAAVFSLVKRGSFGRFAGYVLYPGEVSGVLFYTLICTLPVVLVGCVVSCSAFDVPIDVVVILCLLAVPIVPTCVRFNRKDLFVNWWGVQLGCIALTTFAILSLVIITDFDEHSGVAAFRQLCARAIVISGLTPISSLGLIGYVQRAGYFFYSDSLLLSGTCCSLMWVGLAFVRAVRRMSAYTWLDAEALIILARQERIGTSI